MAPAGLWNERLEQNMRLGVTLDPGTYTNFGSGMNGSVGLITNFARVPGGFTWRGRRWASSEHAFQAVLRVHPSSWGMFVLEGALSAFPVGGLLLLKRGDLSRQWKHYAPTKTGRPEMIGILAKMAVTPQNAAKCNIRLLSPNEDMHDIDEMAELFIEILLAKYTQCEAARVQLVACKEHLVEHGRQSRVRSNAGSPPLWTGLVGKDGTLYGQNLQGELQMHVRKLLAEKGPRPDD